MTLSATLEDASVSGVTPRTAAHRPNANRDGLRRIAPFIYASVTYSGFWVSDGSNTIKINTRSAFSANTDSIDGLAIIKSRSLVASDVLLSTLDSASKTLTTTTRLQYAAEQILETIEILKETRLRNKPELQFLVDEATNVIYTALCNEEVRSNADIMTPYYGDQIKHLTRMVSEIHCFIQLKVTQRRRRLLRKIQYGFDAETIEEYRRRLGLLREFLYHGLTLSHFASTQEKLARMEAQITDLQAREEGSVTRPVTSRTSPSNPLLQPSHELNQTTTTITNSNQNISSGNTTTRILSNSNNVQSSSLHVPVHIYASGRTNSETSTEASDFRKD